MFIFSVKMFLTVLRAVFWLRPFLVLFSMKSIKKKKRSPLHEALSWYHVSAGFCETPTCACSHAALGTSGQAQRCAASEQVGLQHPRPWRRMRPSLPRQPSRGCVYLCVCVGASVCVQRSRGWEWISGCGDAGVRRGEVGDGRGEAGDGRAALVPLLLGRPASTEPLVPNLTF